MEIIESAKSFGFRQLPNGARLYGHVPHVAPEAWLHEVFAPLSDSDIQSLDRAIGLALPADFRTFLRLANGMGLFSGSLAIDGKRTSYVRVGDDAWQPFCIVAANVEERPRQAKPWQLIVGGYRSDGSLVSIDVRDGSAFRTKARSSKIVNQWSSFWTMLSSEACRLAALFDTLGHRLSEESTAPAATEKGD
jgi:hypothetical protein